MVTSLLYALIATLIISFMSLVGIFFLTISDKTLNKIILSLVGFSAGTLIGGAFLHLLPEALETSDSMNVFLIVIVGICAFYMLERLLKWHHCHENECDVHTLSYMNLLGDGVHNFIDGLLIYSTFNISIALGMVTTLIVILHEIPQEIGDFAVLIYGGFSKVKALAWNFVSAIIAVFGAMVGYFTESVYANFNTVLVPFAAGGFIYIAMSDLIPELHKEQKLSKSLTHFILFTIGIMFMLISKLIFG